MHDVIRQRMVWCCEITYKRLGRFQDHLIEVEGCSYDTAKEAALNAETNLAQMLMSLEPEEITQ